MDSKFLWGKPGAQEIKEWVKDKVKEYAQEKITLGILSIGEDEAGKVYRERQKKDCLEYGIGYEELSLEQGISQQEGEDLVEKWSNQEGIHGVLPILPFPKEYDTESILEKIPKEKDVDCTTVHQLGGILTEKADFYPCTPGGILSLLKYYEIPLKGKHCVIMGRSNVVGKPMGLLLLKEDATVTYVHSKSQNIESITKLADILIVAIGQKEKITGEMVKEGSVVIDVGIHGTPAGLVGDVKRESVIDKVWKISPVPGGVGVMTRCKLMENTVKAFLLQKGVNVR